MGDKKVTLNQMASMYIYLYIHIFVVVFCTYTNICIHISTVEDHFVLVLSHQSIRTVNPKDDMFFFPNVQRSNVSNLKKGPWLFWGFLGDEKLPSLGGVTMNH